MKKLISSDTAAMAAMVLALALGACDSTTEHEEHAEADGVELVIGNQVVASYEVEDQSWDGELEVDAGAETAQITVRFVDHDGDEISFDEEVYLEAEAANESIAEFELSAPGAFTGKLRGKMEGQTGVTFRLMHGEVGRGHPDLVTTPVQAQVSADPN